MLCSELLVYRVLPFQSHISTKPTVLICFIVSPSTEGRGSAVRACCFHRGLCASSQNGILNHETKDEQNKPYITINS